MIFKRLIMMAHGLLHGLVVFAEAGTEIPLVGPPCYELKGVPVSKPSALAILVVTLVPATTTQLSSSSGITNLILHPLQTAALPVYGSNLNKTFDLVVTRTLLRQMQSQQLSISLSSSERDKAVIQ